MREAWGKPLAIDTETTGLKVYDGTDYATGASIAFRNDAGQLVDHYFPFRHWGPGNYDQEDLANLRLLIENAPHVVFHNAKFDITTLEGLGITVPPVWLDTAVLAYLYNENFPASKKLEDLTKNYVGPSVVKEKSPEFEAWVKTFGWKYLPAGLTRKYAANDARITYLLAEKVIDLAWQECPPEYWWKQKRPLMEVVRQMQKRGVRIDVEWCERYIQLATDNMADLIEMTDGYNPGSSKAMNELFCEKMGLPKIMRERKKKNKVTGQWEFTETQTFDNKAMAEYELMLELSDDPRASYVLAYRGWQKAKGFYEAYLKFLSPDGRLRPSYRHHKDDEEGGTVTGRLSCAEPNLQQIPRLADPEKKPWAAGIKQAFIPEKDFELWEADYSQLELRLGTAYAREPHLKEVFIEARDIFTEMALALGLARQDTKTLVYSMQYGAGIQRIMNALGLSQIKAKAVRENYFTTYPRFKAFSDRCKREVELKKKIELWSGRHRHFVSGRDGYKAMNSVIQGGSADIMERTMIRVYNEIDQESNGEVRMLLQVHDSIIFEIKKGRSNYWIPRIVEIMEDVNAMFNFDVKFAVEAKPLHERYQHDYAIAA